MQLWASGRPCKAKTFPTSAPAQDKRMASRNPRSFHAASKGLVEAGSGDTHVEDKECQCESFDREHLQKMQYSMALPSSNISLQTDDQTDSIRYCRRHGSLASDWVRIL